MSESDAQEQEQGARNRGAPRRGLASSRYRQGLSSRQLNKADKRSCVLLTDSYLHDILSKNSCFELSSLAQGTRMCCIAP